jgi:hypothetical protein
MFMFISMFMSVFWFRSHLVTHRPLVLRLRMIQIGEAARTDRRALPTVPEFASLRNAALERK